MRPRFVLLLLTMVFSAFVSVVLIGQKPIVLAQRDKIQNLFVEDPRPLAKAAELLEHRFGWRITYEDPPYVYIGDLVDNTAPEYRGPLRALTPAGRQINVDYPISTKTGKLDDPRQMLQLLLDAHTLLGNPELFRFMQNGEVFHIVPSQVRNTSGVLMNVVPTLEVPITF